MTTVVSAPISIGELFDKISILQIKASRIFDESKLFNINLELSELERLSRELNLPNENEIAETIARLKLANESIWQAEDEIREYERKEIFDDGFLAIARSIYKLNDARADAKREINLKVGSKIIEEKSYSTY